MKITRKRSRSKDRMASIELMSELNRSLRAFQYLKIEITIVFSLQAVSYERLFDIIRIGCAANINSGEVFTLSP